MSQPEQYSSTLRSLPSELRVKIFTFVLLPATDRFPKKDDFNALLISRQIYHEIRHLPPQLYPASLSYEDCTPRLPQMIHTLNKPYQIAHLRRLEIQWLYPSHLATFLDLKPELQNANRDSASSNILPANTSQDSRFLFQEPSINLDILKIYTDDWMTKASTSQWRRTTSPGDVQYSIPGPKCDWLVALCQLQGFKQLELVFPEGALAQQYWERGPFIGPLLRNFGDAMKRSEEERVPEWTLWHKWTPDEDFGERLSALRTKDLHAHRYPQWGKGEVGSLMNGKECLRPRFQKGELLVEGSAGRSGLFAEIEPMSFHVGELLGEPKKRQRVCGYCAQMLEK